MLEAVTLPIHVSVSAERIEGVELSYALPHIDDQVVSVSAERIEGVERGHHMDTGFTKQCFSIR